MTDRKLRVLFLTGRYGTGGKERQLTEIIKNTSNVYDNYLFCKKIDSYYLDEVKKDLIEIVSLEARSFKISHVFSLASSIRQINPDVVFSMSTVLSHMSFTIKHLLNLPFVLINGSIRNAPENPSVMERVEAGLYKLYPIVVGNSYASLLSYKQSGRDGRYVLRNGVSDTFFEHTDKKVARKMAGLAENGFLICMIARMESSKDYFNYLYAASETLKKCPECIFYLVGDGYLKSRLEQLALELDLKENVRFLGIRKDIQMILKGCDISILLSTDGESLSNSIIESMATGTPVICSRSAGNSEIIENGRNGFLIDANDPNTIGKLILELKSNSKLLEGIGLTGSQYARKNFSMTRMVNDFKNMVENSLKGRKYRRSSL